MWVGGCEVCVGTEAEAKDRVHVVLANEDGSTLVKVTNLKFCALTALTPVKSWCGSTQTDPCLGDPLKRESRLLQQPLNAVCLLRRNNIEAADLWAHHVKCVK